MKNSRQIRIALLGGYPADLSQIRGGVQAATAGLVSGLSQLNNLELHWLTFQNHGGAEPEQEMRQGYILHRLPPLPRFERLRGYHTYQAILNERIAKIQPQVIHTQEGGADAYVALHTGYPTVITLHGIRNEDRKYYPDWNQRIRFYMDSLLIERQVVRNMRYLIAISRYVTNYFAGVFRQNILCFSIPNAVDEQFLKLENGSDQAVVLFAGRVTPRKQVMSLVQAFDQIVRKFPSTRLHIAGDCHSDGSYVNSIREYIHQVRLENNIFLLGELSQERILQEYTHCKLLVLPSSQETAPVVIAQAMAAGKPVVATQVGGVAEMLGIDGERGLLVSVGDINGMAEAILKLLQDEPLRQRIGESARRFALENYHPHRVAERTVEVYRKIIAREGSRNG